MRHSVIGGLVLATAAVLSGPQPARAQEPIVASSELFPAEGYLARGQQEYDMGIPGRAAVTAPIPTGNPGDSGFYAYTEFTLLTQTFALGSQLVAVRGLVDSSGLVTGQPGTPLGSFTPALETDAFGRRSYQPGYRIGLGYKFDNGISVYANYMQLLDQTYNASASLVPRYFQSGIDLADTFLFSPVWNFTPAYSGPSVETPFDFDNPRGNFYGIWNGATNMDISFQQRFTTAELGARIPILQTEYSRVYGLAGMRYAWFFERFKWRTVSTDILGRVFPAFVANYQNTLSQRMYGAFFGCGHEIYLGKRFAASIDLTGSPLVNIAKERAKYELGDKSTQNKHSRNDFTIVPNGNADMNLWWYPIEGVQMRFGYTAQTYFNTRHMGQPIDFNYGAMDPTYGTQAFRIVHGFNVGLGLFF